MNGIGNLTKDKGEVASGIVQRATFASDTERLARRSAAKQVRRLDLAVKNALREHGHIAVIWDVRKAVG